MGIRRTRLRAGCGRRQVAQWLTAGMLIAPLLVACGGTEVSAPTRTPAPASGSSAAGVVPTAPRQPPTVEEARAQLDRAIARGSAGDHAGAWDLLVPEDQTLIPRDDYVAYQQACNADAPQGAPYEIVDIRLEDPNTALAIVKVLGVSLPVHAFYRDGQWLTRLSDTNRTGVTAWTATRTCPTTTP